MDYQCSEGHDLSAPHPLTECLVWGCHGTLTALGPRGGKKKTQKTRSEDQRQPS